MSHASRYGSARFEAASALPLEGGLGRPRRLGNLLAATARQPSRFSALIQVLAETRSEHVYLSDGPAGQTLRAYFDRLFLGMIPQNRLCRGVLLLPRDHGEYTRGRHRQALRTNLRRARRAGICCELTTDTRMALEIARAIVENRRAAITHADLANLDDGWPVMFAQPQTTLLISRDRQDRPLGVMAAVIDDAVCLIQLAVASDHNARWALHDRLVRLLIDRGVTHLLAEGDGPFGALGFAPGVRHFQRLLGYELRHLIPMKTHTAHRPVRLRAASRPVATE